MILPYFLSKHLTRSGTLKEKYQKNCLPENFALFLSGSSALTRYDIERVSSLMNLSPIIVHISGDRELKISRGFSRQLSAPIVSPNCYSDFKKVLSVCRFSICEHGRAAFFSILAKVPTYMDITEKNNRHLIAQMTKKGCTGCTVFPYTRGGTGLLLRLDINKEKTFGHMP